MHRPLTSVDEDSLINVLPEQNYKIIFAAYARVYHAPFSAPSNWRYSGLKGVLVLGQDMGVEHGFWFRLVDVTSARMRVLWMHNVSDILDYQKDKPFFHFFSGKSRMYGFRFEEDDEAQNFYQRVKDMHIVTKPQDAGEKKRNPTSISKATAPSSRTVSAPVAGSFAHVSHLSIDPNGIVDASQNIDPRWIRLLKPKHCRS